MLQRVSDGERIEVAGPVIFSDEHPLRSHCGPEFLESPCKDGVVRSAWGRVSHGTATLPLPSLVRPRQISPDNAQHMCAGPLSQVLRDWPGHERTLADAPHRT